MNYSYSNPINSILQSAGIPYLYKEVNNSIENSNDDNNIETIDNYFKVKWLLGQWDNNNIINNENNKKYINCDSSSYYIYQSLNILQKQKNQAKMFVKYGENRVYQKLSHIICNEDYQSFLPLLISKDCFSIISQYLNADVLDENVLSIIILNWLNIMKKRNKLNDDKNNVLISLCSILLNEFSNGFYIDKFLLGVLSLSNNESDYNVIKQSLYQYKNKYLQNNQYNSLSYYLLQSKLLWKGKEEIAAISCLKYYCF